ncbi:MAG: hypothetical protein ACK58T_20160, partial [Phycisphaerae bacterium]
ALDVAALDVADETTAARRSPAAVSAPTERDGKQNSINAIPDKASQWNKCLLADTITVPLQIAADHGMP